MKPSIPKGTRDFTPEQIVKRNYIFDTVKSVFIKYGFQPIETPTMEKLSTLTGKYGEEGDQLLFKVLNSGDYLRKAKDLDDHKKLTFQISEKGLRYDLTVPFARYVVMHQNDIAFPFKRYQIQPVWRADRPQRGRYREFYQCDVDIVGSDSLMYEVDLVNIYDEVFTKLGINTTTKINNRKVLAGMAEAAGIPDKMIPMTIAIDKLDKVGIEGVRKEMREREINDDSIEIIENILKIENLTDLKNVFADGVSEIGQKGVEELETVFDMLSLSEQQNDVIFDITLARGLSYYTGCIFEVAAKDVKMGSIGGGGRYDDLTGMFGLKDVSGVGVSFGAERIYDVMDELGLFPKDDRQNLKLLFVTFDEDNFMYAYKALLKVRQAGINAELFPEPTKMKKQMKYANARNVPFVAVVGNNEMNDGVYAVKNMETGVQEKYDLAALIELLK
ncbi:MAG: histidyl-tRNA synthetase [Cognaticolwellia sp.]|jgi:histidyl-tRNA synthetase